MSYWKGEAERLESFRKAYRTPTKMAVHAAFYMEPVILQQLLQDGKFETNLLNNIKDSGVDGMFPIRYITKCWDIVLRPEAFKKETRDFVSWLRLRNNQVKNFYRHWGFDIDKLNIEYWDYDLNYTVFDDYEEEFINDAIDKYGEAGTREIDVQHYMAGMKCNIPKVKQLLEEGANTEAPIYDYYGCHTLKTDLFDKVWMMSQQIFRYIQEYWENTNKVRDLLDNVERPLNSLLMWAGYESVMQVLMESI